MFRRLSSASSFVLITLLSPLAVQAGAVNTCAAIFDAKSTTALEISRAQMFSRDPDLSKPIERRIKILVSGLRKDAVSTIDPADQKIDFADPSLTMPITYPNGVTKYRINASGLRYIEADRPDDFFRGGIFQVQRSRGFYPDGSEMRGAYHNEAWSWDV
ncbi:MAG: hypothetical protein EOP05_21675, partial [Proteobacteria bacterium]